MSWLTGSLVENGWLTSPVAISDTTKKFTIAALNPVVDISGNPVTHTFGYWFITQDDVDLSIYNNSLPVVVDKGTGLQITNGVGEVVVVYAVPGQSYTLVAFDSNKSNYFRCSAVITEESGL